MRKWTVAAIPRREMANGNNNDTARLNGVFPHEVWHLILGNLRTAQDYQKISSASPYFEDILRSKATTSLYADAMKLVMQCNPELKSSEWMDTRLVCRSWKKGLDKLLQTQEHFFLENYERLEYISRIPWTTTEGFNNFPKFYNTKDVEKFRDFFAGTHATSRANPFNRRKVAFLFCEKKDDTLESMYGAIVKLLQTYGQHLWYCEIHYLFQDTTNAKKFYGGKLSSMLELMPNLRALKMRKFRPWSLNQPSKLNMGSRPVLFPFLPHLKYLGHNDLALATAKKILETNPHIEYLEAFRSPQGILKMILKSLPDLRGLSCSICDDVKGFQISNVTFTTRVERMSCDFREMNVKNIPDVFKFLGNRFSLVELYLRLPLRGVMEEATRLRLPTLKKLHLSVRSTQSLDFLLGLKATLEELKLTMDRDPYGGARHWNFVNCEKDQFKLFRFWKEPQKSKIWEAFPKLKIVETRVDRLENYSSTREDWEAQRKGKKRIQ